jgi:hypothetical protein
LKGSDSHDKEQAHRNEDTITEEGKSEPQGSSLGYDANQPHLPPAPEEAQLETQQAEGVRQKWLMKRR